MATHGYLLMARDVSSVKWAWGTVRVLCFIATSLDTGRLPAMYPMSLWEGAINHSPQKAWTGCFIGYVTEQEENTSKVCVYRLIRSGIITLSATFKMAGMCISSVDCWGIQRWQ